jgi:hypothetical protein
VVSAAKKPFLEAIRRVLEERRQFLPLSDRAIHYALLNDPPLIHASKRESVYGNNPQSYNALTELLTRARLEGLIPMSAIADETRRVVTWQIWPDVGSFIKAEFDDLFRDYYRDLLRSQPLHLELVIEKLTLLPLVRAVAGDYTIPLTVARGYISLPPRAAISERFRLSGKDKLGLVIVSDLDPDGEEIANSLVRSLRDDFDITQDAIVAHKAGLTAEQVRRFSLPRAMKAKATSSRYKSFVRAQGDDAAWEVEALAPAQLQLALRETIDGLLDMAAFNRELDAERADSVQLEVLRRRVLAAVDNSAGGQGQ